MATIVTTDHLKDCFETTIIDGKQWYICGVDPEECDTTATTEEVIRHHLRQSHGVVDTSGPPIDHQIDEQMDTKSETPVNHRSHRSGRVFTELTSDDSNDTSSDESVDQMDAQSVSQRLSTAQSVPKGFAYKTPTASAVKRSNDHQKRTKRPTIKSKANVLSLRELMRAKYITMKTVDNEKWYSCQYDRTVCQHETKGCKLIAKHVNSEHLNTRRYRCREEGCGREYATATRLYTHHENHRCGYSIVNGDLLTGDCGNDNLYRYRETVRKDGLISVFKCRCNDCTYETSGSSAIRDHIHGIHVCPHRKSNIGVEPKVSPEFAGNEKRLADNKSRSSRAKRSVDPVVVKSTQKPMDDTNGDQSGSDVFTQTNAINGFDDNWFLNANPYKCSFNGCGKTFMYSKALLSHQNKHLTQDITRRPVTTIKATANQIRHKYVKTQHKSYIVEKLVDRSVYRHQRQDRQLDRNYVGLMSIKKLPKEYFHLEVIDGHKSYACRYSQWCAFKTRRSQAIAGHINCVHLRTRRFRCSEAGCLKVYLNPGSLRQHELNHLCGFGIDNGKTMQTICSNKNINRFRQRVIVNNTEQYYRCSFMDCQYQTRHHMPIKRHIHNQHVCPHRIRIIECTDGTAEDSDLNGVMNESTLESDCNFGNNGIEEEVMIIDDSSDDRRRSGGAFEEFLRRIQRNGIHLSYDKRVFLRSMRELERLLQMKPYFERKLIDSVHQYVCKECHFRPKTLPLMSTHLRLKHLK